jgi:hypothetical protein
VLKVSEQRGGDWVDRDCPATFARDKLASGKDRLTIALPRDATGAFRELAELMHEPFFVLYILHTPRGEGEPGRYQSEEITSAQLSVFLDQYERFFACDARHDLWVKSLNSEDLVVWDRHNDIFAYGDIERFAQRLGKLGFVQETLPPLGDHQHHYRPEFDAEAAAVLNAFDWYRTPLRPEDEQ